jgi:teichuronic acid biosynthesis glycosyltransferase TuaC
MRILLLTGMYPTPSDSTNGAVVAKQRESLQAGGIEIDILHCRPQGKRRWFASLLALHRATVSGRYQLVHAHYGLTTTVLAVCQPLPLVVTYHGTDINGYPFTSLRNAPRSLAFSAAALLTRQLARRADAVIVMTSEMKQRLPAVVRAKTSVVPMGIDTTRFYQHPREKARAMLGWGSEPVVLFSDNNSESLKRRDLAEAAVCEARRYCSRIRLFVLRGVAYEKVPLILSAADCLLLTSEREGSPNIVWESLACNLPIISVPVGDVPDLLALNPLSGHIVPRDPIMLGKALIDVISRPRPINLASLIQDHSLEATAQHIIRIYSLVLQRHSSRRTDAK